MRGETVAAGEFLLDFHRVSRRVVRAQQQFRGIIAGIVEDIIRGGGRNEPARDARAISFARRIGVDQ